MGRAYSINQLMKHYGLAIVPEKRRGRKKRADIKEFEDRKGTLYVTSHIPGRKYTSKHKSQEIVAIYDLCTRLGREANLSFLESIFGGLKI